VVTDVADTGPEPHPTEKNDTVQRLDGLLRTCIQCGLCLPHCATYLATGSETFSPRGRLLLLGEVLRGAYRWNDPDFQEAFATCLGCRACDATCPSGLSEDLLEYAREAAVSRQPSPVAITARLDSRLVLGLLRRLAANTRRLLSTLVGATWRQRFERGGGPLRRWARLLGSVPASVQDNQDLLRLFGSLVGSSIVPVQLTAAEETSTGGGGPVVAFFRGCANDQLLPGTSSRLRDLLWAAGCRLFIPEDQECCGALAAHTGRSQRAAELQAQNLAALTTADRYDHLVVEAAGCGLELRRYPETVASRVIDATVLLDGLSMPPLGAVPLRVAVHDPCHARHGQGVVEQPRRLLARIPELTVVEPPEATVCCGSGGAYSLQHQELSQTMGRRKARLIADTGADLVVTTNPGCLGQIADGLALESPDLPVVPLSDLLWFAWQIGGSRSPHRLS